MSQYIGKLLITAIRLSFDPRIPTGLEFLGKTMANLRSIPPALSGITHRIYFDTLTTHFTLRRVKRIKGNKPAGTGT